LILFVLCLCCVCVVFVLCLCCACVVFVLCLCCVCVVFAFVWRLCCVCVAFAFVFVFEFVFVFACMLQFCCVTQMRVVLHCLKSFVTLCDVVRHYIMLYFAAFRHKALVVSHPGIKYLFGYTAIL